MTVVRFDITERSSFSNGEVFSGYGPFERIEGKVHFRVDANASANHSIVDLKKAADENGNVEFFADFSLVTPIEQDKGSGKLLVDIPNRGNRLSSVTLQKVFALTDDDRLKPGDGFLCHQGYSYLSIGWQWDAQGPSALKLDAPIAKDRDRSGDKVKSADLKGQVLSKLQSATDRSHLALIALGQTSPSYPVHDPENTNSHCLYVKSHENDRRELVPREQWCFGKSVDGKCVPSENHIFLKEGFKRGLIYELCYQTKGAPIVGAGLLAIRDVASCLKFGDDQTLRKGGFDQVYAFGVSQTGRVLRQFLFHGLNADEKGRRVYDGMWIHIAGAQRGDFNHRFAQPTVVGSPSLGQRFPFAATSQQDLFSAKTQGLLDTLKQEHTPKIVISNTSFEYWRGDASLAHIHGDKDVPEHPATRIYHIAGTHHIGGILVDGKQLSKIEVTNLDVAMPLNVVNASPVNRALLTILDQWVAADMLPPDSIHPRLSDATAATRDAVLDQFASRKDIPMLSTEKLQHIRYQNPTPDNDLGIVEVPVDEREIYPVFVSQVNEDLNEVAGIQLPDLRHPLGVHTGWNPRALGTGAEDQAALFAGFTLFFDRDRILDHYPTEDNYLSHIRDDIAALVEQRFVLSQDRDWLLKIASDRYRAAIAS